VARRKPDGGLTTAQIEDFTDVMVSKLAHLKHYREPDLPAGEIGRDEIRQVIADTVILCESDDPSARLEEWLTSAWDQGRR
jgi:hypothetical protein